MLSALDESGGRDVRVLWSLGAFYSQAGHYDQATACMQRIAELIEDPERQAACFLALGQIEEQKGDYHAAATRYQSGIALGPRDRRTAYFLRNNLGYCLNEMQEDEAAAPHPATGPRRLPLCRGRGEKASTRSTGTLSIGPTLQETPIAL